MISANMANIDTPNYTPVEIQFEEQLKSFLAGNKPVGLTTTDSSHFSLSDPIEQAEVEFDAYTLPDQKGNSVDIDHESSKLAENQILYRSLINAYSKRMTLLKHAITEGKQ
jgi:flagellar basal-body rod protein FlgB